MKDYHSSAKAEIVFTVIAIALILAFAGPALAADSQSSAAKPNCNDQCRGNVPGSSGGACKIPTTVQTGWVPLPIGVPHDCEPGFGCYCSVDANDLCKKECAKRGYGLGSCTPRDAVATIPDTQTYGYGKFKNHELLSEINIATQMCRSAYQGEYKSCVCSNVESELEQALSQGTIWFVAPHTKECAYSAAEGVYIMRVAGLWRGGQALRIDVQGASGGVGMFPDGWFFETRRLSRSYVDRLNQTLTIKYQVIPYPRQSYNSASYQSQAANYPADFGRSYSGNVLTMEDVVVCEPASIPLPTERLPPIEGAPKAISYRSITCSPLAGPYQNTAWLVDYDSDSWVQFAAPGTKISQQANDVAIRFSATGAPGTAPPGHVGAAGPAIPEPVCGNGVCEAGEHVAACPGDCPLSEQQAIGNCKFVFDSAQDLFGFETSSWDTTDDIVITNVKVGNREFVVNQTISPDGTIISYADFGIQTPIRANTLIVNFQYRGTPALREFNPFPDAAVVTINVTPSRVTTGQEVMIQGTVGRREFTAQEGRILWCYYQWKGGCYPCIGVDCNPGDDNYIGLPNWASMVPIPFNMNDFTRIVKGIQEPVKLSLIPPIKEYKFDIYSTEAVGAAEALPQTGKVVGKWVSGMAPSQPDQSNDNEETLSKDIQQETLKRIEKLQSNAKNVGDEVKAYEPKKGAKIYFRNTIRNIMNVAQIVAVNAFLSGEAEAGWGYGILALDTGLLVPAMAVELSTYVINKIASIFTDGNLLGYGWSDWLHKIEPGWGCLLKHGLLGCAIRSAYDGGRCEGTGDNEEVKDDMGNPTTRFGAQCPAYISLITWWNLESVQEPDPDAEGDYAFVEAECKEVSAFEEYLFNAIWWTAIGDLADSVNKIMNAAGDKKAEEYRKEYNKYQTCEGCLKGVTYDYSDSVNKLKDECQEINFGLDHLCADRDTLKSKGYGLRGVKTNEPCSGNEVRITSKPECESFMIKATAQTAPGVWCAKNFAAELYGSDNILDENSKPRESFSSDSRIVVGNKQEEVGKCVPHESECPDNWKKITGGATACKNNNLQNITQTIEKQKELKLDKLSGDCDACVNSKGVLCVDVTNETTGGKEYLSYKSKCKFKCDDTYVETLSNLNKGDSKVKIKNTIACSVYDHIKKRQVQVATARLSGTTAEQDNDLVKGLCSDESCETCLSLYKPVFPSLMWCINNERQGIAAILITSCINPTLNGYVANTANECPMVRGQIALLNEKIPDNNADIGLKREYISAYIVRIEQMIENLKTLKTQYEALKTQYEDLKKQMEAKGIGQRLSIVNNHIDEISRKISEIVGKIIDLQTLRVRAMAAQSEIDIMEIMKDMGKNDAENSNFVSELTDNLNKFTQNMRIDVDALSTLTTPVPLQEPVGLTCTVTASPKTVDINDKIGIRVVCNYDANILSMSNVDNDNIGFRQNKKDYDFEIRYDSYGKKEFIIAMIDSEKNTYKSSTSIIVRPQTFNFEARHYVTSNCDNYEASIRLIDKEGYSRYDEINTFCKITMGGSAISERNLCNINVEISGADLDGGLFSRHGFDFNRKQTQNVKFIVELTIDDVKYAFEKEGPLSVDKGLWDNCHAVSPADDKPAQKPTGLTSNLVLGSSELISSDVETEFSIPELGIIAPEEIAVVGIGGAGAFTPLPVTGKIGVGQAQVTPGSAVMPSSYSIGSGRRNMPFWMTLLSMINGPFATGLKATEEAWAHLGTGQVVYQRQFIVPPGTDPKCPDKDPVFRGKVNLARKRVLSEKVDEVPIEPYPYPTSQGPETAIETTAFITIKNATGGIAPNCDTTQGIVRRDVLARQLNVSLGALPDAVDCYRIPIRTSFGGVTGAYRYFYTAPYDGPFTVVISAAGSASYMKAVEVGRKQ